MAVEISQKTQRGLAAGAGVFALVLFWAWWDGGEEPVHPIAQSLEVQEQAR